MKEKLVIFGWTSEILVKLKFEHGILISRSFSNCTKMKKDLKYQKEFMNISWYKNGISHIFTVKPVLSTKYSWIRIIRGLLLFDGGIPLKKVKYL